MAMTDPEDLKRMQHQALDASNAAAQKTLEGFQRLTALNMEIARSALEQSSEQIDALLSARDARTLAELATSFAKLSPEKFTAYANAVYTISRETGADISSVVEKQITESNAQLAAALQSLARQATGGAAGGAGDFISQSMNAAKSAYEQMQTAARQFASGAGGMSGMGGMGSAGGAGNAGRTGGSGAGSTGGMGGTGGTGSTGGSGSGTGQGASGTEGSSQSGGR